MNVLLIPSTFPTARESWPGSYVLECARSVALEHDVTVVYPQQLGASNVGSEPFYVDEMLSPRLRLINFTYAHIPKTWLYGYLSAFRKPLRQLTKERRFDVIFAHVVLPAGAAAALWGRRLGIPTVLTEHWGPAEDWLKKSTVPNGLMRRVIRKAYSSADYLTAVSESLGKEIENVFGVKAKATFDQPIDCNVFYPAPRAPIMSPAKVICVTRGDDPRKGVDNLIAAWQIVSERKRNSVRLQIIAPDVSEISSRIEDAGLSSTCELFSWLSSAELADLYREASIVVIPSRYETFGRSGAEGMACGVPVVSTRCGGPNEYVSPQTGLLVEKENPQALADGIISLLDKRGDFLPAQELAKSIRERFGYEAVCQHFNVIAEGLTGKR